MFHFRQWTGSLIAVLLLIGPSRLPAQWVTVARAAKNHVQRLSQRSGGKGYDVATVILEANSTKVYDKALNTMKANPGITITKSDSKLGVIEFRNAQQIAGLQIASLGDKLTQLVIASSVSETDQPGGTPPVVDAVLRVCKEVGVECSVQP